jgi:magnesium transporter
MSTTHDTEYAPLDPDTGFSLSPEFVSEVQDAIHRADLTTARALVYSLPAPDQAELFDQLSTDDRRWLTEAIASNFDAETLAELSPEAAEDVLEALGAEKSAEVLAEMETDDAVHILEDLDTQSQQEILEELPEEIRHEVEESLTYPEESAGRMMRKTIVAVPESWTVGDTIDYLREAEDLPEIFYILYTVDAAFAPTGRILLSAVLSHKRDVQLADIRNTNTYAVGTETDQEEIAFLFRKYALVEAPVVNEEGRLVGTITVDDVVDVIQEEQDEDYLRAGGVSSQDFQATLWETARARFLWLFVNLLMALAAASVIRLFEDSIEKLVALAVMMPMVASMGGNTGTQSVTVAVRAIAIKYLTNANKWHFVRKEMLLGLVNGAALGALMALGSFLWFQDMMLSLVLAVAAVFTMTVAGLFGAFIPILLNRLRVDPAISSSIFLTTVTDCAGFFSFLGLATLILL